MRLLQHRENGTISLTEHVGEPPPYAILSHTWGADNEEVTFRDLIDGTGTEKEGYHKLKFCGQQAARHGLEYYWIDTCCIDKASSAELSEAINSMFRWYRDSSRCYVYLTDVSMATDDNLTQWKSALEKSKWFTRGWTLQELIAPTKVELYSHEGTLLGDKFSLLQTLHEVTGVARDALKGGPLALFSVEERLSWAAKRTTKREEDAAYSLLGLFDVHMSLIYGEGREKALKRLLREIEEHEKTPMINSRNGDQDRAARVEKIYQWLAGIDPLSNYQQALRQRQGKTGLWLIDSEEYRKWKNESSSFLWLHGIPGSGKTILSSTIIHNIIEDHEADERTAVLMFYFDFNDSQKQSADSMLRSLIYQLSQQLDSIPSSLGNLYDLHEHGRQQPTAEALLKVLCDLMQKFEQTFVVFDALDECSQRADLMHALATISQWQLRNSHIVVTSRRERDVESYLQDLGACENSICLRGEIVDNDIRHYVRQRLSDDTALRKWSKDLALREEIEKALIKGSQGMFRWTVCQLDTLGKCRNRATLRRSLAMLPQTLEKTYDRILSSISEQDSVYAIKILRWLTFAERPLSLDEIAEAVAVIEDRDPVFDEDEVLQDPLEALDICSSLITIRDSGDTRENSSQQIAVLAHYTVKEYLLSHRIRASSLAQFSMHYEACHSSLARACVGYLLQNLQPELEYGTFQVGAKLLNYCVEYWMIHVEEARDVHPQTTQLVVSFLAPRSVAYLSWLHLYYSPDRPWTKPVLAKAVADVAEPLYYAALFRLGEAVRLLLENGADANAQGGQHGNALSAVAGSGHEGNVKLLLTHGAHVDQLSPRHGSALQVASEVGHEEVVKLLLAAGGDVNLNGGLNGSALDLAIGNQHTAIVSLLLENGAQVEPLGCDEMSSLTAAAYTGNLNIVKLLISYGASISAADRHGWTPMNSASVSGHLQIVELLIQAGADMNTASKDGWTPVNSASSHGLSKIVGALLSAGANLSTPNDHGWTPLIAAVDGNHHNVVRLLLDHDASSPFLNAHSNDGHTALSRAAELGYIAIVKLLLAKGASTLDEDLHGKQAFAHAAINGSNAILILLHGVPEAGPDHRDRFSRSTLWWAAAFDRPDTVKFLLHELRSNPSVADVCGRTPLSIAIKRQHRHVVSLLEETSEGIETIELIEDPKVVCDICEFGIPDSDVHFNCSNCAKGDWDICAECKGHGLACLDHTHTLTKRTYQKGCLVEV